MLANSKKRRANRVKVLPPCRVSISDHAIILNKVACSGLSFSEFQRRALNDAEVIIQDNLFKASLLKELSALANNLNQLVKNEHIHSVSDTHKMRGLLLSIDIILMDMIDGSQDK